MIPDLQSIREAAKRIRPYIHRTPVLSSKSINIILGAEIYFKCENFQKVGAFKSRGACNAVFSLTDDQVARGVATHSSGNHAQALARAALIRGCKAYIVMPETSPKVKSDAVKGYGGEITFCEPTLEARETTLANVIGRTGATEVHPYNDYHIITGQATAVMELLEEIPAPDIIMAPIGGGGLMSGTALATSYLSPAAKIYAAEPAGADDAYRSFTTRTLIPSVTPKTIADGLLTSLGSITFPIILEKVHRIFTVSEESIIRAMMLTWERMKIVIEPSSAVPLAAIMENQDDFTGKKVGIIISGGNVSLDKLPWIKTP